MKRDAERIVGTEHDGRAGAGCGGSMGEVHFVAIDGAQGGWQSAAP
jgi:hypothetical protein